MGSTETKKNQGGFRPPKLARRSEAEFEISNLNLTLDQRFDVEEELRKSSLERQIETIVHKWLLSYKFFTETQKLFSNKDRLNDAARTFRRADGFLPKLLPYLREDPRVPSMRVEYIGQNKWVILKATDFLRLPGEKGILSWIADWIAEIRPQTGRPPNKAIANCAEELAIMFKERTSQSKWEKVGQIVAKAFAQYLPPDDGVRDHRLWIRKLVKRNRQRKQRIRAFNAKSKAD